MCNLLSSPNAVSFHCPTQGIYSSTSELPVQSCKRFPVCNIQVGRWSFCIVNWEVRWVRRFFSPQTAQVDGALRVGAASEKAPGPGAGAAPGRRPGLGEEWFCGRSPTGERWGETRWSAPSRRHHGSRESRSCSCSPGADSTSTTAPVVTKDTRLPHFGARAPSGTWRACDRPPCGLGVSYDPTTSSPFPLLPTWAAVFNLSM